MKQLLEQARRTACSSVGVTVIIFAGFGRATRVHCLERPRRNRAGVVRFMGLADHVYLQAHRHLRNAERSFRLDRIVDVKVEV